ncbi:hypothetical protein D3C78_1506530 [compost metagenome]
MNVPPVNTPLFTFNEPDLIAIVPVCAPVTFVPVHTTFDCVASTLNTSPAGVAICSVATESCTSAFFPSGFPAQEDIITAAIAGNTNNFFITNLIYFICLNT